MDLRVPLTRIADIVNKRRGITADTAQRFARYFKNTPAFWMNLQTRYDLEVAEDELADKVERDVQPLQVVRGDNPSSEAHLTARRLEHRKPCVSYHLIGCEGQQRTPDPAGCILD